MASWPRTTTPPPSNDAPQHRVGWRVAIWLTAAGLCAVLALVGGVWGYIRWNTTDVAAAPVVAATTSFQGRYLLVASDADMIATAYADGVLQRVPGDTDTMSLIHLPLTDATARVTTVPVSKSVTSWPQIVAVAPDGNTLYVVETAGQVDADVSQLATEDFPMGRLLTVVDISGGAENAAPRTIDVGEGPAHIAISADGAHLAIGLREASRQLLIAPTATLHDPSTFRTFAINDTDGRPAHEVTAVSWHPTGQFLAVGNDARALQFFQVALTNDGDVTLSPYGPHMSLGNTITYGEFTRDGRFFLTAEINWNTAPRPLGNLVNPPGEMMAVQFDADNADHRVVSRVPVGLGPEGFAISPQEDLIVTVNMRRTYLPNALATLIPGAHLSSLSLLSFNNQTGQLRVLGEEYGFEGVLPEHALFDTTAEALAVVIYNQRDQPMDPGTVAFWNVVRDGQEPRLERTSVQVPVTRGGTRWGWSADEHRPGACHPGSARATAPLCSQQSRGAVAVILSFSSLPRCR